MNKTSIVSVEREARSISRRAFSGGRRVVYEKEKHIVNTGEAIRRRWNVAPQQWQAKHVRWFLEVYLSDRSAGTRYRYFRYLRAVLIQMNRWDDMEGFISGDWTGPGK